MARHLRNRRICYLIIEVTNVLSDGNKSPLISLHLSLGSNAMAIQVTQTAVRELKKAIAQQRLSETVALRIGVVGGGCSGFEYKLEFDEYFSDEKDVLTEIEGLRVAVDKKSALYLDGIELDFHESFEKSGFTFKNPNATKSCGCGSSFST